MNDVLSKILSFLKKIGISYQFITLNESTLLPGITLNQGALIIDLEKLLHPGDILHEAGHLACMPPDIRKQMTGDLENNDLNQSGEIMAIAWSYAACRQLDLDPEIVFHDKGYNGGSKNIINNFNNHNTFGVPMLQWCGMCYDANTATKHNAEPFPSMISWTCTVNKFHPAD